MDLLRPEGWTRVKSDDRNNMWFMMDFLERESLRSKERVEDFNSL